jgi:septal ring factor EnvC (AmiA/AmiB activator)
MAIDTLRVAKRLREAGFTEPQAEAVTAVQQATQGAELATKVDFAEVKTEIAEVKAEVAEIKTDLAEVKAEVAEIKTDLAEVKADVATLRGELRQSELRLEAKIEAVKTGILSRVSSMILGALVVNIIAVVGAMFAVAKLA